MVEDERHCEDSRVGNAVLPKKPRLPTVDDCSLFSHDDGEAAPFGEVLVKTCSSIERSRSMCSPPKGTQFASTIRGMHPSALWVFLFAKIRPSLWEGRGGMRHPMCTRWRTTLSTHSPLSSWQVSFWETDSQWFTRSHQFHPSACQTDSLFAKRETPVTVKAFPTCHIIIKWN